MTFNEERKIRRCLESVRWCDEIVILDSFSTDRTVEICREYTDRVVQQSWLGYVGQRNQLRELATGPWVLVLDSDEEVSPGLRDEIQAELERDSGDVAGYEFPRLVYFIGKWIRHGEWYPDMKLRLFRKSLGRSEGQEPHDRIVVSGRVKRLRNPLWHYTYDDMSDQIATLNRFSTIASQQRFVEDKRFRWGSLLLHSMFRFIKCYFIRRGFLDGAHGFMIAVVNSFGVFMKYAKLWELERRQKGDIDVLPPSQGEE